MPEIRGCSPFSPLSPSLSLAHSLVHTFSHAHVHPHCQRTHSLHLPTATQNTSMMTFCGSICQCNGSNGRLGAACSAGCLVCAATCEEGCSGSVLPAFSTADSACSPPLLPPALAGRAGSRLRGAMVVFCKVVSATVEVVKGSRGGVSEVDSVLRADMSL